MRRIFLAATLLSISVCSPLLADESRSARRERRGHSAGYASRDATVLSMVGWGVGIAAGFAAICALIENDTTSNSSTAH